MKQQKILKLILIFSIISISMAETNKKKLGYLKVYVNTYNDEKIFNDKFVSKSLQKLLGKEKSHLLENLSVRGPIDMISGELVISGIAPHQGGSEEGIVSINIYSGEITAVIYSNKKFKIYTHQNKYDYLPRSIQNFLILSTSNRNLPKNAIMITKK